MLSVNTSVCDHWGSKQLPCKQNSAGRTKCGYIVHEYFKM